MKLLTIVMIAIVSLIILILLCRAIAIKIVFKGMLKSPTRSELIGTYEAIYDSLGNEKLILYANGEYEQYFTSSHGTKYSNKGRWEYLTIGKDETGRAIKEIIISAALTFVSGDKLLTPPVRNDNFLNPFKSFGKVYIPIDDDMGYSFRKR